MAKKIYSLILCCVLVFGALGTFSPNEAYAQTERNQERAELTGTRKQLATIIFSGLAGAILGLSTLSFHGRPQEKLSNIAVGFAVGIIGGAIYTTYKTATRPYEVYDLSYHEIEVKRLHGMDIYQDISFHVEPRAQLGLHLFSYEF